MATGPGAIASPGQNTGSVFPVYFRKRVAPLLPVAAPDLQTSRWIFLPGELRDLGSDEEAGP